MCISVFGAVFKNYPLNKKRQGVIMKLKNLGMLSLTFGLLSTIIGFVVLEYSNDFWSWNSTTRTIMEFAPWFFIVLGIFGLLTGTFYTVTNMKPTVKRKGKVVEKNNNMITVEFDDGSRENLVSSAKIILGDEGTFETKSNFVVNFQKNI